MSIEEKDKDEVLDKIGKQLADMYPERRGSFSFEIRDGEFKGIHEENNIPPKN